MKNTKKKAEHHRAAVDRRMGSRAFRAAAEETANERTARESPVVGTNATDRMFESVL